MKSPTAMQKKNQNNFGSKMEQKNRIVMVKHENNNDQKFKNY